MSLVPVEASFFGQSTVALAQSLIGMLLVKETEQGIAAGWIVETEAYTGVADQAAHSFGNRRTARTEIMYHEPGHVYTYTMHTHCLVNIVCEPVGVAEAVLIRAVEPHIGLSLMQERRGLDKSLHQLTNGPGKLTKALGITMNDYGNHATKRPLFIAVGRQVEEISIGPRIGIPNSGAARHYPYRFWETGNPFVSK
ncbi:DNA-3-methyladenine glycosylase [Paenibacillus yanchengensis]|uniref:Putative 3-methyladenine DNA glycosylase n=1 Tax=Paenibacillus yanchengensis TaxID=2035833 RepID=A0ABW4YFI5_9BACL